MACPVNHPCDASGVCVWLPQEYLWGCLGSVCAAASGVCVAYSLILSIVLKELIWGAQGDIAGVNIQAPRLRGQV